MHWTKTAKGKRRLAEIKEERRQKRTLSQEQKEMRGGAVSVIQAKAAQVRNETVTEALDRVSELLQKTNQAFDKAEKRLSEILSQIQ